MDTRAFKDYEIAKVTDDDINKISELEKSLCTNTRNDIILIAYQPKNQASN